MIGAQYLLFLIRRKNICFFDIDTMIRFTYWWFINKFKLFKIEVFNLTTQKFDKIIEMNNGYSNVKLIV